MKLLREERDRLIAETDWWASSFYNDQEEQTYYIDRHFVIFKTFSSLDTVVWLDK